MEKVRRQVGFKLFMELEGLRTQDTGIKNGSKVTEKKRRRIYRIRKENRMPEFENNFKYVGRTT